MKREWWMILLAFLGGIVCANLLDKELLATYGILNDYFLSQYSYRMVDGNRLFCHVLIERCKAAFIIFLLGRVLGGRVFSVLIKSVFSAAFGFLIVVAIVNLGMRGILVSVCGLLPQWIFYLAALCYYANCRREEDGANWSGGIRSGDFTVYLVRWILLALCMILGILTESYINPVLLGYAFKII